MFRFLFDMNNEVKRTKKDLHTFLRSKISDKDTNIAIRAINLSMDEFIRLLLINSKFKDEEIQLCLGWLERHKFQIQNLISPFVRGHIEKIINENQENLPKNKKDVIRNILKRALDYNDEQSKLFDFSIVAHDDSHQKEFNKKEIISKYRINETDIETLLTKLGITNDDFVKVLHFQGYT